MLPRWGWASKPAAMLCSAAIDRPHEGSPRSPRPPPLLSGRAAQRGPCPGKKRTAPPAPPTRTALALQLFLLGPGQVGHGFTLRLDRPGHAALAGLDPLPVDQGPGRSRLQPARSASSTTSDAIRVQCFRPQRASRSDGRVGTGGDRLVGQPVLDVRGQLQGRRVAVLGLQGQRLEADGLQRPRDVRIERPGRGDLAARNLLLTVIASSCSPRTGGRPVRSS